MIGMPEPPMPKPPFGRDEGERHAGRKLKKAEEVKLRYRVAITEDWEQVSNEVYEEDQKEKLIEDV